MSLKCVFVAALLVCVAVSVSSKTLGGTRGYREPALDIMPIDSSERTVGNRMAEGVSGNIVRHARRRYRVSTVDRLPSPEVYSSTPDPEYVIEHAEPNSGVWNKLIVVHKQTGNNAHRYPVIGSDMKGELRGTHSLHGGNNLRYHSVPHHVVGAHSAHGTYPRLSNIGSKPHTVNAAVPRNVLRSRHHETTQSQEEEFPNTIYKST